MFRGANGERMFMSGSGMFQRQTAITEVFFPVLQGIVVAALAAALATGSGLTFLWLIKQTAALVIFWPVAVFYAWRRNAWATAAFVALAVAVIFAVYLLDWPLHPTAAWWRYAQVMGVPATLVIPVGCYFVIRRMWTETLYPNLAGAVRATPGNLKRSVLHDTIETQAADKPPAFDWN